MQKTRPQLRDTYSKMNVRKNILVGIIGYVFMGKENWQTKWKMIWKGKMAFLAFYL